MKKAINQCTQCQIVRECNNQRCIFKMVALGYIFSPTKQTERESNERMERSLGKGYYPKFDFVGKGTKIEIMCPDFLEKTNSTFLHKKYKDKL